MGKIVTFYSFKGGVGRTFAMANVGALLASWGRRVLCVDWDLEAPGLHEYFGARFDRSKWVGGIANWVTGGDQDNPWQEHVLDTELPNLSLMLAGRPSNEYARLVQDIDWTNEYQKGFGVRLEEMRREWTEHYDVVLIDSRTGVSDTGGICTVQLPDILVALLATNRQNLAGTDVTLKSILEQRQNFPIDRSIPLILPILSKIESRVEYEQGEIWITRVAETLGWTYSNWLDVAVHARTMVALTRLPYIPFWSYEESLPAIERGINDPEDIGYRFATIAMLLARGLVDTEVFSNNRDGYLARAWATHPVAPDSLSITTQANALIVRAEGIAEECGEIVCMIESGKDLSNSVTDVMLDVRIFLNTNVTSRLFDPPWCEATAVLEDLRESTTSAPIPGRVYGVNSILFAGLRIKVGSSKKYRLAIRRIRCNANQLGISTSLEIASVVASVQFTDSSNPRSQVSSQAVKVALIQPGISIHALKFPNERADPAIGGARQLDLALEEVSTELEVAEGFLGAFQNYAESGGDCGTRFAFRFRGIPEDASLMVTRTDVSSNIGRIQLVQTDANGAGGSVKKSIGGWETLLCQSGAAAGYWEWTEPMQPGTLRSRHFRIGVKLVGPRVRDQARDLSVAIFLAPFSAVGTASRSDPIPRFADTSSARKVFALLPERDSSTK